MNSDITKTSVTIFPVCTRELLGVRTSQSGHRSINKVTSRVEYSIQHTSLVPKKNY